MSRKVIWSPEAEEDLYNILAYWIYRNRSASFSIKLEREIQDAVIEIAMHPQIGKKTEREHTRLKLVRDYWVVYDIEPQQIVILSIFDTRQDDEKLTKKIK